MQDSVDTFEVYWNGSSDSRNPRNWSTGKKWANVFVISVAGFLCPLVSSMPSPATPLISLEFKNTSSSFPTFVVSIFVLGFAFGSPVLAPLSEVYGRVPIYHSANLIFLLSLILCAIAQNSAMILAFRFLSGFGGGAAIAIAPGSITDMMKIEERGRAISIWAVGTILGPMIGPVVGAYITGKLGWRWMFWIIAVVVAIMELTTLFVLKESYAPTLLEKEAIRMRKETGNQRYQSKLLLNVTFQQLFVQQIIRPIKMLVFLPVVTLLCTYVAILYGILYLLFATYPFVFHDTYGFSTFATGLVYIPGAAGTLLGLFYIGILSDKRLKQRAAIGWEVTPEDRLPLIITAPGVLMFPAGLFMYGWSGQAHTHWIVPLLGTAITGFGSIVIFTAVQTYLVDAFQEYAASAIGANIMLRGIVGALIPVGGLGLYERLGWGWGNSLLAFLALIFAPVPFSIGVYGAQVRALKLFQVEL